MEKLTIINYLIERFNYESYLEIGVQHKATFDRVKCKKKIGIDPNPVFRADYVMTSNEFFEQNKEHFDIVFIDGFHEFKQARLDIFHSVQVLNLNGTIVVHDCNPTSEQMQRVPRKAKQWTGDTWKAFVYFRKNPFLYMFTVDTDYGVGIIRIRKGNKLLVEVPEKELTYDNLEKNRKEWLNLVSVNEWKELL